MQNKEEISLESLQMDIDNLRDSQNLDNGKILKILNSLDNILTEVKNSKNLNNAINRKIKAEYEALKKVIINENVSVELFNKITDVGNKLNDTNNSIRNHVNQEVEKITKDVNEKINEVNSQLDDKANLLNSTSWVNITHLGAKGDGVTDNTSIIQSAIDNYKTVFCPSGTYAHTGLTINPSSRCIILGEDMFNTIFLNVSLNDSIVIEGNGTIGYGQGTTIENITISTNEINDNQHGINLKYVSTILLNNVNVIKHDIGIVENCSWNGKFYNVLCNNNNIGWCVKDSTLNATPNHRFSCACNNNNKHGVYMENDIELFKWYGGEIGGNGISGIEIHGDNIINIEFDSINFENNNGLKDVIINNDIFGSLTSVPRNISFTNCRFHRSVKQDGTIGVNIVKGYLITFNNCTFSNYSIAVIDYSYGTDIFINCYISNCTEGFNMKNVIYDINRNFTVANYLGATQTLGDGTLNVNSSIKLNNISSSNSKNNSIFLENNELKFKDGDGIVKTISTI